MWQECKYLGLAHLVSAIIDLYSVWRVRIPLAWLAYCQSSYGRTLYGASVDTFGLANLSGIVWLYAVWRELRYLGPGSSSEGDRMAVRCMAQA